MKFYRNPVANNRPIIIQVWRLQFTLFSWGFDFRLPRTWLTVVWRKSKKYAYLSPDGTPDHERARLLFGSAE